MKRRALALLWSAGVLAACGGGGREAGPPEVAWGERECDRCRMIASEPRYAAAALGADGAWAVFDDLDCLAAWARQAPTPSDVWVHDHRSGEWIDGRTAVYDRQRDLVTPMGSGLVARRADASEVPAGSSLNFQELIEETDDD